MKLILGALLSAAVVLPPAYADDPYVEEPERGIPLAAVVGGAQATVETVRGYAVTADCKVLGFVAPNRRVDLVVAGRAIGTGPTGIVADSATIRCEVYDAAGGSRVALKVSGGPVSVLPDTAMNFARAGLTVCASGATLFRQQQVELTTDTVCAAAAIINA